MNILKTYKQPLPAGRFGAIRKYDTHTGVDLYCEPGSTVYAIEDGILVGIEDFTGPEAGSPWWHSTKAILVEGPSGVVVYGEVEPFNMTIGRSIYEGYPIGTVKTVLKEDKGLPMTMLHMELYKTGTRKTVWWREKEKPEELLNVELLLQSKKII